MACNTDVVNKIYSVYVLSVTQATVSEVWSICGEY